MTTEAAAAPPRRAAGVSGHGFGAQMLFLHGHIADPDLAPRLAGAPTTLRPRRPAWRRLVALLGSLGQGAIRAFSH
jgi:hypothetical protein